MKGIRTAERTDGCFAIGRAARGGARRESSKSNRLVGRISSESEPPNLATEKNAGCCALEAANLPSPVRMRDSPTAKTPRNRANFSDCSRVCAPSL